MVKPEMPPGLESPESLLGPDGALFADLMRQGPREAIGKSEQTPVDPDSSPVKYRHLQSAQT